MRVGEAVADEQHARARLRGDEFDAKIIEHTIKVAASFMSTPKNGRDPDGADFWRTFESLPINDSHQQHASRFGQERSSNTRQPRRLFRRFDTVPNLAESFGARSSIEVIVSLTTLDASLTNA